MRRYMNAVERASTNPQPRAGEPGCWSHAAKTKHGTCSGARAGAFPAEISVATTPRPAVARGRWQADGSSIAHTAVRVAVVLRARDAIASTWNDRAVTEAVASVSFTRRSSPW